MGRINLNVYQLSYMLARVNARYSAAIPKCKYDAFTPKSEVWKVGCRRDPSGRCDRTVWMHLSPIFALFQVYMGPSAFQCPPFPTYYAISRRSCNHTSQLSNQSFRNWFHLSVGWVETRGLVPHESGRYHLWTDDPQTNSPWNVKFLSVTCLYFSSFAFD